MASKSIVLAHDVVYFQDKQRLVKEAGSRCAVNKAGPVTPELLKKIPSLQKGAEPKAAPPAFELASLGAEALKAAAESMKIDIGDAEGNVGKLVKLVEGATSVDIPGHE